MKRRMPVVNARRECPPERPHDSTPWRNCSDSCFGDGPGLEYGIGLEYDSFMHLLDAMIADRQAACERERLAVRERLRAALGHYLPSGSRAWLYGSLVGAGRFVETSDIDLALEADPPNMSIYLLSSLLAERCGREVDLCLLSETRLESAIRQRGEPWTL